MNRAVALATCCLLLAAGVAAAHVQEKVTPKLQANAKVKEKLEALLKPNAKSGDFSKNAAEPEQVGYYDSERKLIVAHRHKATSHYDPRTNVWKKVMDEPKDSDKVPF